MKFAVNLDTHEWHKLGTKFDRMAARIEKAANRKAVTKASKPMLREARNLAPVGKHKPPSKPEPGQEKEKKPIRLKKSLKITVKTYGARSSIVQGRVTGHWYARVVEFGHDLVKGENPGRIVGHVPPHPFLRPAFDNTKDESQRIYKAEIWKEVQAAMVKERAPKRKRR